jgi:hypothetical protein
LSGEDFLDLFKTAASQWLCDPYSIEIRYIARNTGDFNKLLACTVYFWPIGKLPSASLRVNSNQIIAGSEKLTDYALNDLKELLKNLENGKLIIGDLSLTLEAKRGLSFYTEMISNDRWFCDAHLKIKGDAQDPISSVETASINSQLRLANPPFDGLSDLLGNLNLPNTLTSHQESEIEIRISPPVDIRVDESTLSTGKFKLVMYAHPKLDIKNISLAIREFPESLSSRRQVASHVKWKIGRNGLQVGTLLIKTKNSFAVQAILMTGASTVRRQFFDDISKAPNRRLAIISCFDKDLKMLKRALNGDIDSDGFETAINSLAYLMGFSGSVMNEVDAPDIILSSPNENLVLVECTTRIKDFATKLGKLVDRKNALIASLKNSGDSRKVYSYLVCSLPRNQIAFEEKVLAKHKVVLLTKESLNSLLEQLKFPKDLEELLLDDEKQLESFLTQDFHQSNPFGQ